MAVIAPVVIDAKMGYREAPGQGTTRAHIWWTDNNASETGYRVEWSGNGVQNWRLLTDVPANSTSASHDLTAAQKYYYRVSAIEGSTLSAPSVIVSPMTGQDRVVQVTATASGSTVRINWPLDPEAVSYQVWRKARSESTWTLRTPVPLAATSTGFTDSHGPGQAFEYQVARVTHRYYASSDGTAYGYVYAGNSAPMTENRGRALLVIDQTQSSALTTELSQYRQDLTADGWEVVSLVVPRDNGNAQQARTIKTSIQQIATSYGGLQSIVLIGHVPVPYSGTTGWDGHPDHAGAWPADVYYGESIGLSSGGNWTDNLSVPNSNYSDNNNLPGDGKFDNDSLPAPVNVPVGRIDFSNLPGMRWSFSPMPATTAESETLLLKRYFVKNHAWRTGAVEVSALSIEDDHLGGGEGENGWRNFAPLTGSTYARDWSTYCLNGVNYTWSAGMGPGGFTYAENVVGVEQMHSPTVNVSAVFSLLGGSYFGDWNKESNLLREVVAANGVSLATLWTGAPNSFIHTMGLGETIGQAAMTTQNNTLFGPYSPPSIGSRGPHVALMGDPTLIQRPTAPPKNVVVSKTATSANRVTWDMTDDLDTVGFYVYRGDTAEGPFTRLTHVAISSSNFTDNTMPNPSSRYYYMVRAVKLQTSPSGTYYDVGAGAIVRTPRSFVIDFPLPFPIQPTNGRPGGATDGVNRAMNSTFSARSIIDSAADSNHDQPDDALAAVDTLSL